MELSVTWCIFGVDFIKQFISITHNVICCNTKYIIMYSEFVDITSLVTSIGYVYLSKSISFFELIDLLQSAHQFAQIGLSICSLNKHILSSVWVAPSPLLDFLDDACNRT